MLLAGQRDCAQNGNENQDRGHLEGKQQVAEEDFAQVGGGDYVVSQACLCEMSARGEEDEGQETDEYGYSGDAYDVGGAAAMGSFFFPGVEEHDDEGKENHDGAGIDDDLGGGQEFGS